MARRAAVVLASGAMLMSVVSGTAATAATAKARPPRVLHLAQIDHQDIAPQPGSEPDTLVEPHVAVSPLQPHTAVAVAHDGRFPDGGAVDIGYAWTRDGGSTWHHAPVPGLTKAVGGSYDRASDPVVQFAADGTAYLSTLLFAAPPGCLSAVAVSRSTDGGATWGPPVLAHESTDCNYSDDKNWLVIDNSRTSPHFGRIYQFWTPFISLDGGNNFTDPQALRFSDDHGTTWSETHYVNPITANTQDSQPMITADGTIVDTYQNYGPFRVSGDSPLHRTIVRRGAAATPTGLDLDARTSHDGGLTWTGEVVITDALGQGPADVRCCLPAANIDHATGRMYAVWEGAGPNDTDPVELSSSTDGVTWSAPQTISRGDVAGVQQVNVTVAADQGRVFVTYGTRTDAANQGGFVQQELSASTDGGATFAAPLAIGPPSALQWAAQAGGLFPGDYIGAAIGHNFLYLVWCVSSQPTTPAPFHQVLWSGTLRY